MIDRHVAAGRDRARRQHQMPVGQGNVGIGRDHEDFIDADGHALADFADGHRRLLTEDFRQMAFLMRVEVDGDQKGHAGLRRQFAEQLGNRFQSAGRGANADNRKRRPSVRNLSAVSRRNRRR